MDEEDEEKNYVIIGVRRGYSSFWLPE